MKRRGTSASITTTPRDKPAMIAFPDRPQSEAFAAIGLQEFAKDARVATRMSRIEHYDLGASYDGIAPGFATVPTGLAGTGYWHGGSKSRGWGQPW